MSIKTRLQKLEQAGKPTAQAEQSAYTPAQWQKSIDTLGEALGHTGTREKLLAILKKAVTA
ncbi:MAG: hypothetical protein JW963_08955 [Anaerolineales bacterium]|nr:hypothetical protein [Anaerolineales bacterium]